MTRAGRVLFLGLAALVLVACGGGGDANPSATRTATPEPAPTEIAPGEDPPGDQALYLAMGDSLSEGVAATDPKRTAWVPLVAKALGDEYELLNLGVAGHDSRELIEEGPLDAALTEIANRANDGVEGNEVALITLEIGGNDLLDIYFELVLPGLCPSVTEGLQRPVCVESLESALDIYRPNLAETLDALQEAAPGVPIFLATLYNPFSGGSTNLDELGALGLEGQEGTPFPAGVNDVIREEAAKREGITVVEWFEPFLGKQSEYISLDLIHPNDTGYAVLAEAMMAAMAASGFEVER